MAERPCFLFRLRLICLCDQTFLNMKKKCKTKTKKHIQGCFFFACTFSLLPLFHTSPAVSNLQIKKRWTLRTRNISPQCKQEIVIDCNWIQGICCPRRTMSMTRIEELFNGDTETASLVSKAVSFPQPLGFNDRNVLLPKTCLLCRQSDELAIW